MKSFSRWQIILTLAGIFLIGSVTGATMALGLSKTKTEKRLKMTNLEDSITEWARTHLDLTPEQVVRIKPLIELACDEYRAEQKRTLERVIEIIRASNDRIAKELNPDQVKKLELSERKHEDYLKKKFNL